MCERGWAAVAAVAPAAAATKKGGHCVGGGDGANSAALHTARCGEGGNAARWIDLRRHCWILGGWCVCALTLPSVSIVCSSMDRSGLVWIGLVVTMTVSRSRSAASPAATSSFAQGGSSSSCCGSGGAPRLQVHSRPRRRRRRSHTAATTAADRTSATCSAAREASRPAIGSGPELSRCDQHASACVVQRLRVRRQRGVAFASAATVHRRCCWSCVSKPHALISVFYQQKSQLPKEKASKQRAPESPRSLAGNEAHTAVGQQQ
jgi:hypothetical protein